MFEAQLDMNVAVSENQVPPINGNFEYVQYAYIYIYMYIYIYIFMYSGHYDKAAYWVSISSNFISRCYFHGETEALDQMFRLARFVGSEGMIENSYQ